LRVTLKVSALPRDEGTIGDEPLPRVSHHAKRAVVGPNVITQDSLEFESGQMSVFDMSEFRVREPPFLEERHVFFVLLP
jgi:hypothetical protein